MNGQAPILAVFCTLGSLLAGCAAPLLLPYSTAPKSDPQSEPEVELVGDVTYPYGMNYVQVEAVGLVVGLKGTGGDPPPSPQRAVLIGDMKRRDVDQPGKVLSSPNTAMVISRALLRPGVQKGDRLDIEVKVPTRGNATSLRGGTLLPVRLSELAAVGQQIHNGHVLAYAEGPVLVDPSATQEDEALATQGRILGGGVVLKDRALGLGIDERFRSFRMSQLVGSAVNRRFHTLYKGEKQGVANPQNDTFIELRVHPRYRENISRYMQVVRSIAIEETPSELIDRMTRLEQQLGDPLSAQVAALRLEAIGTKAAIETLKKAANGNGDEAQFYAAESLAYLDQTAAVDPLAEVIRSRPEFRVQALAALSAMNDRKAYEALRELLNVNSAETRYGAFRALWAMDPHDPIVQGERLGDQFTLHVLPTSGPPMVHVTNSLRPEIVIFGRDQKLRLPTTLDAGLHILVNGSNGSNLTISRFSPGVPVQKRVVEPTLEDAIEAVVDLGGTYPDVVQMLQEARQTGALECWFRVDAVPGTERQLSEVSHVAHSSESEPPSGIRRFATSWPSLFGEN